MTDRDRVLNILGWGAFAFSCSVFLLPIINPDLFWHLSAGRWTLAHLRPPTSDFLSWPLAGQEWIDFEWLPQVFYYLLDRAGGLWALLLFKAALLAGTLLVFRRTVLLYGRRAALPLALPFFAAAIVTNSDLRPENFSLLFFALTLYALEKRRPGGEYPSGWRPAVAAFLFFALWANLHAGYLYGLALIGLYSAGEFLEEELPYIYGKAPFARPVKAPRLLALFFSGLAASLATPYGWKAWTVIANHQRYISTLQEYIQEWNTFDLTNAYQWPYVLALAGVFGSFAWFVLRRRHACYPHFAALLFFAWGSANHARHIPFFIMTGLVFLLALPWEAPRSRGGRAAALAGAALLLAGTAFFYSRFIWTQYTGRPGLFKWGSPGLGAFLKADKKELAGLKLYNPWGWGGWLGWELGPDYKVFIDGRYLFHDKIREVVDARSGSKGWNGLINKYGFDLMLITLDEPKVPVKQRLAGGSSEVFWRPAYLFYLPRRDWAVIYWDYSVAAIVRRSAVPAAWLAAREYRWLRPADTLNLVAPLLAGEVPFSEVEREADRYLRQVPAGFDNSPAADVVSFMGGLKKLCAQKGAGCRR